MAEGQWDEPYELRGKLWQLKCGPVFTADISHLWHGQQYCHRPTLNGEALGYYPKLDRAKARVEWEIWNRVRQMKPAYRAIMDRRASWEVGSG